MVMSRVWLWRDCNVEEHLVAKIAGVLHDTFCILNTTDKFNVFFKSKSDPIK